MKIFVHRYKHSHERRRARYRRLYKDGKVTREKVHNGWVYTVKEEPCER